MFMGVSLVTHEHRSNTQLLAEFTIRLSVNMHRCPMFMGVILGSHQGQIIKAIIKDKLKTSVVVMVFFCL